MIANQSRNLRTKGGLSRSIAIILESSPCCMRLMLKFIDPPEVLHVH